MLPVDDHCQQLIDDFDGKDLRKMRRAVQALKERARFPCLEAALRDPRVSRTAKRDITEILYNMRWPEAAPVLIEQLRSDDPDVRANAAEALGAIEDVSAGPPLLSLLDELEGPTYVRDTAAMSLGLVGYHPAWKALCKYLGDPEKTVRYCSAKALSFLKEPLSREHLREALQREKEEMVVVQIQEALLELDSPQTPNDVATD